MKKSEISMPVVNAHAAGIDIGSKSHWVAVDQLHENVREFGVYTKDHELLIDYLHAHHVTTVAMESTGNYWQTLFNALQKAGFKVILGKGAHTKNISGKKTEINGNQQFVELGPPSNPIFFKHLIAFSEIT